MTNTIDATLRSILIIECNSLLTSNELDINIDDDITDELGDYFDDVDETTDKGIKDAYKIVRACSGESKDFKERDLKLAISIIR